MTLWLPTNLSSASLEGWWFVKDATGSLADGAKLSLTGSTVNSWTDSSGKGRTLTPTAGVTYSANGLATGKPGCPVAFGGLVTGSAIGLPANAMIGGMILGSISSVGGGRVMSLWDAVTGHHDFDTTGFIPIYANSGTTIEVYKNAGTSGTKSFTSGSPALFESTPLSSSTQDVSINTVTSGTPGTVNNTGLTLQQFGAFVNPSNTGENIAAGVIAEVILYSGVPSTSDLQKLEGYIAWANGEQALLPGGHPYAGAAPTVAGGGGGFFARPYYDLNTRIRNL